MAKYIRGKSDGFVYDWNPVLAAREGMEAFDSDESPMPERMPDLTKYLTDRNEAARDEAAPARRRGRPSADEAPK